jgi:hypothetical protein
MQIPRRVIVGMTCMGDTRVKEKDKTRTPRGEGSAPGERVRVLILTKLTIRIFTVRIMVELQEGGAWVS